MSALDGGHRHTKIMTKLERAQQDASKAWDALMTMESATVPIRQTWYAANEILKHEAALDAARAELQKEQNGNA